MVLSNGSKKISKSTKRITGIAADSLVGVSITTVISAFVSMTLF